ncbi:2388_t:CDS:2 [Rhizophagus irregularis]|nr:2388_t:CDS:2 [Rhizophagus irregularis]
MSVNKANQLEVLRQCISELKAENAELNVANLRKELGNKIEELEKNGEDAESRLAKVEQDSSVHLSGKESYNYYTDLGGPFSVL